MKNLFRFCLMILGLVSSSLVYADTHEYVDLGLPSGTLWATENINTTNYLYGWGDITGTEIGSGSNAALVVNEHTPYVTVTMDDGDHKVSDVSKYTTTDGLTTLEQADDAAYQAWGSDWRMPTKVEFEELINNCTVSISGGVATLTGPNGKTITFALGKFSDGDEVYTSSSNAGYYWTSSSTGDQYFSAYSTEFKLVSGISAISVVTHSRIWGGYIRPVSVTKAPPYVLSDDGTVLHIKEGIDITTVATELGDSKSAVKELYIVGDYTTTASINALKTSYFSNLEKVHLTLVTESDAIAESAYASCSLLYDITIPENITSIDDNAFTDYDDYRKMTFPSTTPATLSSASALPYKWLIYVPNDALDTYKNAEYWIDHASQIVSIGTKSDWNIEVAAEATASAIHMAIGDNNLNGVVSLKIKGGINSYDIMIIRNKLVNLRYLDLSEANVVTNTYEYYTGYCSHDNMLERYSMPTKLLSLELPTSLTSLGAYALEGLTKITEINLPDKLQSIGAYCFQNCSNVKEISFSDGLLTIGNYCFLNCSNVKIFNIPNSVTSMGTGLFSGCASMTDLHIPFVGTSAISPAFLGTLFGQTSSTGLYKIGFSSNIQWETNYQRLWSSSDSYKYYYLPSNLTNLVVNRGIISTGAIAGVSNVILENVASIEKAGLWGSFKKVEIQGTPSIAAHAFYRLNELIFNGPKELPDYICEGGTKGYNNDIKTLVIGESVEKIGKSFYNARITNIYLYGAPNVTIDDMAFYNQKVNFAKSDDRTYIGDIKNVYIYDLEKFCTINFSFYSNPCWQGGTLYLNGEKLENVVLPESITKIMFHTFYNNLCIKSVYGPNVTTIDKCSFEYCVYLKSVSFPKLTKTGEEAFVDCTQLTSATFGNDLTEIGSGTFYNCSVLENVELGNSYTSIGSWAFYNCSKLATLQLPNTLESIGSSAFNGCTILQDLELPASLKTIGGSAFSRCTTFKNIQIPASVTSIGTYAFNGCTNLGTCVLPTNSNLTAISDYTFNGCSKLQKMDLPTSVKTIGNYAFQNCTALTEVKIPSGITNIGSYAFGGCTALNDVYTYTIVPQTIDQNTFSTYKTATLHMPAVSYYSYFYDTQWSQFLKLENFDAPYDYVYIDKDFSIYSESAGTIDGNPDVDIATTGGLTVIGNTAQSFSDIHIKAGSTSSASLIGNNNLTADNLYLDIDVKADYWHFFCFPFDVDLTKIEKDGSYVFRRYAPELRATGSVGWQDIEGTTLQAGQGYIFRTNTAGTLSIPIANPSFSGQNETTALSEYGNEETTDDNKNWNFIGNRYTAYYDINEMSYTAPIIIWNGTAYAAYRPGDDELTLTPYQAFFVQKPGNVENVEFDKDGRTTYQKSASTTSSAKARLAKAAKLNSNRHLINLTISDGQTTDKTRVVFNNEQNMGYEMECDASKFISNENVPLLYSLDNDGIRYAINERPVDNGNVQLGVMIRTEGVYTISAPRMDTSVVLVDNKENIVHDFADGDYTFTSETGTFENRFVLSIANPDATVISNLQAEQSAENARYDLSGRKVTSKQKGLLISNGKKLYVK